jgi:hypothetical protein
LSRVRPMSVVREQLRCRHKGSIIR